MPIFHTSVIFLMHLFFIFAHPHEHERNASLQCNSIKCPSNANPPPFSRVNQTYGVMGNFMDVTWQPCVSNHVGVSVKFASQ